MGGGKEKRVGLALGHRVKSPSSLKRKEKKNVKEEEERGHDQTCQREKCTEKGNTPKTTKNHVTKWRPGKTKVEKIWWN